MADLVVGINPGVAGIILRFGDVLRRLGQRTEGGEDGCQHLAADGESDDEREGQRQQRQRQVQQDRPPDRCQAGGDRHGADDAVLRADGHGNRDRRPVGIDRPLAVRPVAQRNLGGHLPVGSSEAIAEIRIEAEQANGQHIRVLAEGTEQLPGAPDIPEFDYRRGIEGHHVGHGEQFGGLRLPPLVDFADRESQEGKQQADAERGGNRQSNFLADSVAGPQRSPPITRRARRSIWEAGFRPARASASLLTTNCTRPSPRTNSMPPPKRAKPSPSLTTSVGMPSTQRSTAPIRASSTSGMKTSWQCAMSSGLLARRTTNYLPPPERPS